MNLPPLSDIKDPDKNLCFIQPVDEKKLYIVEFDIFLKDKPSDLNLIAEYHVDDYFPKFEFRYFRVWIRKCSVNFSAKKLTLFIIFAFSNAGHIIKGRAGLLECVSAVPAAKPVLWWRDWTALQPDVVLRAWGRAVCEILLKFND